MDDSGSRAVARSLAAGLTARQRRALVGWSGELLRIRASDAEALEKARRALAQTLDPDVADALGSGAARALKRLAWDDRSWTGRLGVGAVGLATLAVGVQAAALTTLGAAVAVPLWIVLGDGGAFAGALMDELARAGGGPSGELPADGEDTIEDAEFVIVRDPPTPPRPDGQRRLAPGSGEREPLWRVFRRAYRDARTRQQGGG